LANFDYVKIRLMLILASSSPRRRALLSLLGLKFRVQTSDIDESIVNGEPARDYVLRLATGKSLAINPLSSDHQVIIAADTAVVDKGQILGKPTSQAHAKEMLTQLRNRSHHVLSGIAVRDTRNDEILTDLSSTQVEMRNYGEQELEAYVASGDPMDKAGAYAIQHTGFNPVAQITGCYANVVGLPLCHLAQLLNRFGVNIPEEATRGCRLNGGYRCQLMEKINAMEAGNQ